MRSPSFPTVTRTVIPSTSTVAQHRGSLVYKSLRENRNHMPWNERTMMATDPGDKDHDKNRDRSKKSDSHRLTERSRGRSPLCRDHGGDRTSNSKCERLCGQDSPSDSHKSKQRCTKEAPVLHMNVRGRAPPRVNLCHLRPCSIPLLYRHCAGCLRISQNPALHICPSIRVGARFLPST